MDPLSLLIGLVLGCTLGTLTMALLNYVRGDDD